MTPQETTENTSPVYKKDIQLPLTDGQNLEQTVLEDSTHSPNEYLPLSVLESAVPNTYIDYDSIMRHQERNNIETSEMYKSGTEMPDRDVASRPQRHSLGNDDGIAISMLVMFALISAIVYHSGMFLAYRLKDFFSHKRKYKDENAKTSTSEARNTLILSGISSMSACLILFGRIIEDDMQGANQASVYKILSIGFIALMALIFIKAIIYLFVNWIFFGSTQGRKWLSSYFLMTSASAFILFPLALIEIYSDYKLPQTAFCLSLVFILYELLLFYKLCTNFKTKKHGFPLIFLYFCSVEIMPAFVLWHIFNGANESFIVKI
ncbi:MAG: DUF4271 domain-containing protein [Roseburia sp.]|nr:DUF4271 domain-containing protein [Roseburia sp.]MCM1420611.1 DUF4271 domain-containing protein [Bacteroides sp.]